MSIYEKIFSLQLWSLQTTYREIILDFISILFDQ